MGKISYNSDQISSTGGVIGQASANAGDASQTAGTGFQGLEVFFGPGAALISQQLGGIQGSLQNVQGIIQRQGSEIFNMDSALSKAADMIEVPQDFVKNDANRFTQYHNEILEKTDGTSVNAGSGIRDTEAMDESSIGQEKALGDITTSTETKEEKYDASSVIGSEQAIGDITRAGGDASQTYDGTSVIGAEENLGDITTAGGTAEQEYNGNSVIGNEAMLGNITGAGGLQNQEVNTNSYINGQETIGQLDTTSGLTRQELIDRSRINAQEALGNLNINKAGGLAMAGLAGLTGLAGTGIKRNENEKEEKDALEAFRSNYTDKNEVASGEEEIARARAAAKMALDGLDK